MVTSASFTALCKIQTGFPGKLPQSNWDAHWATMVAPFAQLLLLLLLPAFGQPELPSPDGACESQVVTRASSAEMKDIVPHSWT